MDEKKNRFIFVFKPFLFSSSVSSLTVVKGQIVSLVNQNSQRGNLSTEDISIIILAYNMYIYSVDSCQTSTTYLPTVLSTRDNKPNEAHPAPEMTLNTCSVKHTCTNKINPHLAPSCCTSTNFSP